MKGYCLNFGKKPSRAHAKKFVTTMTTTAYTLKINALRDYKL